jgi:HTH-type transcriptional regulator/antitoxin HigA
MEVRPIKTDQDHQAALREIEALWGAPLGTPEGDRLDVLATLVERYEETRWPVSAPDGVEFLKFVMEQTGRSQSELGHLLGSRSRASEVLNRKRELTLDQIRLIARAWHVPAGGLVGQLKTASR